MLFASPFYRFATGPYRLRARIMPGEDRCEGPRRIVLHPRQDVLVSGHRERRVGVPEALGDDLDGHPVAQQQAGVRVAEIMQTDRCHCEVPVGSDEGLGGEVWVEQPAVGAREHKPEPVRQARRCERVGLLGPPGDGAQSWSGRG